jgi:hypothetical protein
MFGFSFGKLLSGIVIAYIIHQLYTVYQVFTPDKCKPNEPCISAAYDLSESYKVEFFLRSASKRGSSEWTSLHVKKDIHLSDSFTHVVTLTVPDYMRRNTSAVFKVRLTPASRKFKVEQTMDIGRYRPIAAAEYHLLQGKNYSDTTSESSKSRNVTILHIYKEITVNVVDSIHAFPRNGLPGEIFSLMTFDSRGSGYLPIVFCNNLKFNDKFLEAVVPVEGKEDVTKELNLTLNWSPVSVGKLRFWKILEKSTEQMKELGFTEKDLEEMRGIFLNTDLYFLLITIIISSLHVLFDILAFKNDISFWRGAKDTSGLSGRTVMWRCFSSSVIFLYLLEEKTSLLVIIPMGIVTVIEFWKLTRVLKMHVSWTGSVTFDAPTAAEMDTDALDSRGMRYLAWLMVPLCIGSAIYSLLYVPHTSWYSWSIKSLANCVYAFGFLFMTPQLFINYKLKSVAHLPWKALTYKAFNTFIDDFFAFIITMPTTHRLACFRDDVVFFIYLYQRWLYPVDKTRPNEFGRDFDDHEPVSASGDAVEKKTQ